MNNCRRRRNAFQKCVTLLAMLAGLPFLIYGQSHITQGILWTGYYPTFNLSGKWYAQLEVDERRYFQDFSEFQFVTRGHLHRKITGHLEASAGMCLFLHHPRNPGSPVNLAVPELRPHFELAANNRLRKVRIDQRFRMEPRIFHRTDAVREHLEPGYDFSCLRLRYRVQASFRVVKLDSARAVRLKIADELMVNTFIHSSVGLLDQNRVYFALNSELSKNLSLEVGYLHSWQRTAPGLFFNRHILRVMVMQQFDLAGRGKRKGE